MRRFRCFLALAALAGFFRPTPPAEAEPGSEADLSQVPGVVIDHQPASTGLYVGSPSLAVLTDGTYVASHDLFGPKSSEHERAVTRIFTSRDRGRSWTHLGNVEGQFWSTLFVHQGDLYLMGTWKHHGNLIIRRSTDGGRTWTEPRDEKTGLLAEGEYHTAPVPLVVHRGRLWRAVEDAMGGQRWGERYRALVMSMPQEADPLDRASWTLTNVLARDPEWLGGRFGGWLEGNVVVDPHGEIVNILRVELPAPGGQAAMVRVSSDGHEATFDPSSDFIDFPGAAKKFTIRYDPVSKQYWSLSNFIPPKYDGLRPGRVRNTVALVRSKDLRDWEVRCIVLHHPDVAKHGFQYLDWRFEEDDLIVASRTAYDDGLGGAHNNHDANLLTFHRIESFRDLTLGESVVDPKSLGVEMPGLQSAKSGARNVLFIAVDDLLCELGCYGSETARTPNIDRLAASGVLFRRAYCQQALCNPSRSSVLTGLRPERLQIFENRTHFRERKPRVVTLPQWFRRHGYHAVNIGKIFHNWGHDVHGDPDSWSEPARFHWAAHYMDWYVPGRPHEIHEDLSKGPSVQCVDVPDGAYLDGRIARAAIEKLAELKDRPFFLAVGFWKPHLPFNAPKRYWDLYDRDRLPPLRTRVPPRGAPALAGHDSPELRNYTDIPRRGALTDEKTAELRHAYLAAVSFVDAQIGKVLRELERLDLAERTVVVLWSDHGYHVGDHGMWGKITNFERSARVPLIIRAPGAAPPATTDSLVELVDLYPTLVDLCDLPRPSHLGGVSLRPLLEDPTARVKEVALTQQPRPVYSSTRWNTMGYSVRTPRHRYTEWRRRETNRFVARELYDHALDPAETRNLAVGAGHAKDVSRLGRTLRAHFEAAGRPPTREAAAAAGPR